MTPKKKARPPGIHFFPREHELQALGVLGREMKVSATFLATEMFRHSFELWQAGEYKPIASDRALAMFASSKTAKGGD